MGDNPYIEESTEVVKTSGTQIEESRAVAEVKAQVVMARRFPRDPVQATDRILAECDRVTLAEKAVYSYPRGGSQITGPSIRMAEAIARAWGNLAAGVVEVERVGNESSMLAYAWDLETNTMIRREFRVAHVRDTRGGRKEVTDERDIYEITANYGSRRLRACILALVPGDVVEAAVDRCERTLTANVGKIEEAIPKMLKVFEHIGVTKGMIEKRLRHRIEATQAAEIVALRNVYNSIKDGMTVISDFFEIEDAPKPPEEVLKPAKGKKAKESEAGELGIDPIEDIWAKLVEYSNAEGLPAQALKDIESAMERKEDDPKMLQELLNRVEAAYKGK